MPLIIHNKPTAYEQAIAAANTDSGHGKWIGGHLCGMKRPYAILQYPQLHDIHQAGLRPR